jgi:hypothetical protein
MRATLRTIKWAPAPTAFAGGTIALVVARLAVGDTPAALLESLDLAFLIVAAVAGFSLEDDARSLVAAVPVPLWRRRALRVVAYLATLTLGWFALASCARILFPGSFDGFDPGATAWRALATSAVAIAAAAWVFRRAPNHAGVGAAATVIAVDYASRAFGFLHVAVRPLSLWPLVVAASLLSASTTSVLDG